MIDNAKSIAYYSRQPRKRGLVDLAIQGRVKRMVETNQASRVPDRASRRANFREDADAQGIAASHCSGRCQSSLMGYCTPSAGEGEHGRPIVKSLAMSVMYWAWSGSTVIHLAAAEAGQV